jgi:hypothetical protein
VEQFPFHHDLVLVSSSPQMSVPLSQGIQFALYLISSLVSVIGMLVGCWTWFDLVPVLVQGP